MATDATGTPTSPDNIPTYNVDGDAPSGNGFNAAMDAIQTGLSARGKVTTGTLAAGPPGSPSDGDVWHATDVDANGTVWTFKYNFDSLNTDKWEFVGGTPYRKSMTGGSTVINSLTALGASGSHYDPTLSYTLVRQGAYIVRGLAKIDPQAGASSWIAIAAFSGTTPGDFFPSVLNSTTNPTGIGASAEAIENLASTAAATLVGICVKTGQDATYTLKAGRFELLPIRVS